MLPKYHILFGLIFSFLLFTIFPFVGLTEMAIIFLSSFLIDVDHYIYYLFKNKDLSLKRSVSYFMTARKKLLKMNKNERRNFYSGFYFLHGIESLVVLFLLGIFISKYFLFLFIGFSFHLFLDISEEKYLGSRLDKISSIYDWFKFGKLEVLN